MGFFTFLNCVNGTESCIASLCPENIKKFSRNIFHSLNLKTLYFKLSLKHKQNVTDTHQIWNQTEYLLIK